MCHLKNTGRNDKICGNAMLQMMHLAMRNVAICDSNRKDSSFIFQRNVGTNPQEKKLVKLAYLMLRKLCLCVYLRKKRKTKKEDSIWLMKE
jgi:hypothetical protein